MDILVILNKSKNYHENEFSTKLCDIYGGRDVGQFCGWCTHISSIEALQTEIQEERSWISKSPQECAFPLTLPAGDA